jgi:copper homeostasis protein
MSLLEICCYSYASALTASEAGAQRVELCAGAGLGGTTPDEETIRQVRMIAGLKLYVMIRPRGGDFVYTHAEFEQMKKAIASAKRLNTDGVVFGILNADRTVDIRRTKELVILAGRMDITFHKAIDETPDPFQALDAVYASGIKRVLSSGTKPDVVEGMEILKAMVKHGKGRVSVMAGGGVRSYNLKKVREAGGTEFHSSAILPGNKNFEADRNEIGMMSAILDKPFSG